MTQSRNTIARLWTGFWRTVTWLRVATLNLLFLLIVVIIAAAIFSPGEAPVPKEGPLLVTPSGYLVDQKAYRSPTVQLMDANREMPAETLVRDLVDAIEAGAGDANVSALILELDYLTGGALSKLEEVGQALQNFKDSGKPIIAFSDNYTQAQYYLASYADQIYLNSMGAVLLNGFSMYQHYMQEGIEKLDVNVHVFRVGEYKDFVEPFTRNSMSNTSREHNTQWVNELWGIYTSRVESLRELPPDALNDYINNLDTHLAEVGGNHAQLALDQGLVDYTMSRADIYDSLIARFGSTQDGTELKAIPQRPYLDRKRLLQPKRPDRVGLIVAVGAIRDGEQPMGTIGSDTLANLIRNAREDNAIKALVIRVDSGGGSAFASEIIRQELEAISSEGKPVIISMGSVAASGGYWISAPADQIWATPTTITGSIGVFGIFPTFEQTLANMGINVDGITTTELAGADRIDRALSPKAALVAQSSVEFIYERFVSIVAEARAKTPQEIHEVAQGRIWTGATALELGLVDKLGYLNDAIAAAAESANISDYSVQLIERELTPMEKLMRTLSGETEALARELQNNSVSGLLAEQAALARFYQQLHNSFGPLINAKQNGVYAQCLHCGSL